MKQAEYISDHDVKVATKNGRGDLRWQRDAGNAGERQHILDLEREGFKSLCGEDAGRKTVDAEDRQTVEEIVKKRGLLSLGVVVLLGAWLMVIGYEFLEKENALFQKRVKTAKEEQQRCAARNSKYRNYDQFRTSIRLPYTSDLSLERWMHQYDTLRAGMSESEVEIILGAPDYARCDVNKDGDKFVGSEWQYAVAVPQDPANDSHNSGIKIVFGPDRLTVKNA
jgi:hypothetical protein